MIDLKYKNMGCIGEDFKEVYDFIEETKKMLL